MITNVKTQIISAREGIITEEMKYVAEYEGVEPEFVRKGIEDGSIVILKNNQRKDSIPVGVGAGLSVKINANIGTSNERSGLEEELKKVKIIEETGADVLMDLSTGKGIDDVRAQIIASTRLPIGTVPMYQAGKEALDEFKNITKLSKEKLFSDKRRRAYDRICCDHGGVFYHTGGPWQRE